MLPNFQATSPILRMGCQGGLVDDKAGGKGGLLHGPVHRCVTEKRIFQISGLHMRHPKSNDHFHRAVSKTLPLYLSLKNSHTVHTSDLSLKTTKYPTTSNYNHIRIPAYHPQRNGQSCNARRPFEANEVPTTRHYLDGNSARREKMIMYGRRR